MTKHPAQSDPVRLRRAKPFLSEELPRPTRFAAGAAQRARRCGDPRHAVALNSASFVTQLLFVPEFRKVYDD